MRLAWRWKAVLLALALPWLALIGAGLGIGFYWLWQNQLLTPWYALLIGLSGLAWLTARRLARKGYRPFIALPEVEADRLWSPAGRNAWRKVEDMAQRVDTAEYPLDQTERLWDLGREVVETVASHFNPKAGRAELAVPLPYVLAICERVAHDLRLSLAENLPLSHRLTVEDALWLWRNLEKIDAAKDVLRVGRLVASPGAGLAGEAGHAVWQRLLRYPRTQLHRWALETLIKKVGYYAIALYSGQLRLLEGREDAVSAYSAADSRRVARAEGGAEPLRILVAGQIKAGKSSLINALFEDPRAPVDALPLTAALVPYRLERDGLLQALVFDSAGYGDNWAQWFEENRRVIETMDVVLLTCSAVQAARQADERFLHELRAAFAARPDRAPPVQMVVLTHIDQLRPFREWQPPYDVQQPLGPKERAIRDAMEAVADDLAFPVEDVIPVCLAEGAVYNLEAVWTSIAAKLPEAQRARYLRCLRDAQASERWSLFWRQLQASGRFLVARTRDLLP